MNRNLFVVALTLSSLKLVAAPQSVADIREKYHVPALGAFLLDRSVPHSEVHGVRRWGDTTLAQIDDKFHLGSCTKAMTATLLAIFIERGQLSWDSTLGELLPDLTKPMHPAFRNVTLALLTSHHSGILSDLRKFKGGELSLKLADPKLKTGEGRIMVSREILSAAPESKPGTKFDYSNLNYVIVGAILEKISGKSWEELLTQEVFVPLKMSSCGFGAQANPLLMPPNQPWPHLKVVNVPFPVRPDFYADNPPTIGPAGTVHCSMEDWSKFLAIHLDGGRGQDTAILRAESFAKLHESHPDKTYTYGGWIRAEKNGVYVLAHDGSNTLNYAMAWLVPQLNKAALSVTNIGGEDAELATKEALLSLLKPPKIVFNTKETD